MSLGEKLYEYRDFIILAGLALGALGFLDVLPESLPLLEDITNYGYTAIIALAAYIYYQNFWGKTKKPLSFARTAPSRDLSNKSFIKNLEQQRGFETPRRMPPVEEPSYESQRKPSKKLFDTFNKD